MRKKSAEREVITLIEKHLSKVEESLQNMLLTMGDYLQGLMDSAETYASKTHTAESEADAIRHQISELLHRGAFLPLFREDMMQLVGMVDKIAGCARACCKFIITQHPDVPSELKEDFLKISRDSAAILPPLQEGVNKLSEDFYITRDMIAEVNRIEHAMDEVEWKLDSRIFSTSLPLAHKMHLKQLVDVIIAITDIAQDASEILETMIVKKQV